MDTILKDYLDNILSTGLEKDYWFVTKQTMTDFYFIFNLAKVVETYPVKKNPGENFGVYYSRFFKENSELLTLYPGQSASENTYRNVILSEFFGLFYREKTTYESGVVTPAYNLLNKYLKKHDDAEKYSFLIERQIEKLCLNINEKAANYEDLKNCINFPVMFLYKILFELNKKYGDSTLYFDEFLVFVVRAKKYSDWSTVLDLIDSYRTNGLISAYQTKFDSIKKDITSENIRFDALFGKLSNIFYGRTPAKQLIYKIKDGEKSLRYIENALEIFESSKYSKDLPADELRDFLRSDKYFIGNLEVAFAVEKEETEMIKEDKFTPEWFKEKGKEFADVDIEAKNLYDSFKEKFAPEVIKDLKDEELINSLFLGGNSDNMCHELEYVTRNKELFGSIKSGTAFKYPLFKRGEVWMTGTSRNPIELSVTEAIVKGTQVRDALVNGAKLIEDSLPLETVEDYLSLYTKLYALMPEYVDNLWVIKYYHMIFNDVFPVFYNKDWQLRVLSVIEKEPNDAAYGRLGQINIFVKECEISNVVFAQVFHKYCRNIEPEFEEIEEIDEPVTPRLTGGENIILYGVPGAGKSWTIKKQYCSDDTCIERLVFHPDYTYSDFVGQILPKISEDGSVSYVFTAGPFTNLVRKAYQNPDKMYYLVIEEVNRGNAPAIFGDVFQLLDRKADGSSEYEITNADIAKIVYGSENHKVSIPSNMSILCTMNTSDQNVFTLDTAFQRRWSMRLIKNVFHEEEEDEKKFANSVILDTDVTWNKFFTEINKIILNKNIRMTSSEDKRLGTHFVGPEDLKFVEGDEKQNSRFPEKVLKYLWDDAFKFTKEDIFDLEKVKSLEDVIEIFVGSKGNERFRVFKENIFNTIVTNPTNAKENA